MTEEQIIAQELAKIQRGNAVGEDDIRDEKEVYEALSAPFPPEAMNKDSSRGFALTSVKAQYVVERLNDVLGVMSWTFGGDFKETEKGVLYMGALVITINGKQNRHFAPGYAEFGPKKLVGDVYKSAHTDSLSKCASKFGVGNDVFKGLVDPNNLGAAPKTARASKKVSTKKKEDKVKVSEESNEPTGFNKRRRSRAAAATAGDDI